MATCGIRFSANSLGRAAEMNIIVPKGDGPFPVLYLLHGLGGDHNWWLECPIVRMAWERPIILVLPNGRKSYFCNAPGPLGESFEDHIVQDVIGFVDQTFRTIRNRAGRAIAGVSMGGYGAIMLAMRHSDLFSAASSIAGSLYFAHGPHPTGSEYPMAIMDALDRREYDCFSLAEKIKSSRRSLALQLFCGTEDYLLPANREFHRHLTDLALPHEYVEDCGEHNWDSFDRQLPRTLDFVTKALRMG